MGDNRRVEGHLLLTLIESGKLNDKKNSLYIHSNPCSLFVMFLFGQSFPGGRPTWLPNSYFCNHLSVHMYSKMSGLDFFSPYRAVFRLAIMWH